MRIIDTRPVGPFYFKSQRGLCLIYTDQILLLETVSQKCVSTAVATAARMNWGFIAAGVSQVLICGKLILGRI